MPVVVRNDNAIDINTIASQIDDIVITFFDKFNINIYDLQQCKSISHNTLTLCMMSIYEQLFKPDHKMVNNQRSIIDYQDIELLTVLANTFIKWALWFNKSIGIMQFSLMTGIHWTTLSAWRDNPESNPKRSEVIKNICEYHKMEQVGLLNDTPVGALAVANNDTATGLKWAANQVQQITNNTVYLLPSERSGKLKLDKLED